MAVHPRRRHTPFRAVGLLGCLLFLATPALSCGSADASGQDRLLVYPYLGETPPTSASISWATFDWGTAHFVALDTNQSFAEGSTQYDWLTSDLQSNSRPWTFVFFHDPPYSSGLHGDSVEVREARPR